MRHRWPSLRRVRWYAALVVVAACADHVTGPTTNVAPPLPASPPPAPKLVRILCTADLLAVEVTCLGAAGGALGAVTAPAHTVTLNPSGAVFDGRILSFSASLTNALPQPLGTSDGITPDANGVRAVFVIRPTVTQGSGTVDFDDNGVSLVDGIATITAPNQPFYRYPGILAVGATSSERSWRFHVSGRVTLFSFAIDIDAAVPKPNGYVDVSPATASLRLGQRVALVAVVRTAIGDAVPGAPVAWSSSAQAVATVDSTGVVTATGDGSATITATNAAGSIVRSGTALVTVSTPSGATTTMSASAPSVAAGDSSTIVVDVKNGAGAPIGAGGDTVTLSADAGTLSAVVDRGDGTYTAQLRATVARDVHVTGTINHAVIAQSVTVRFVPGPPASIEKRGGDEQTATTGTAVATPPSVRITDANGNPIAALGVTFTVASGGGSVTGGTATTDSSGVATVGSWTLGSVAGANTLSAVAGNLATTFTATGVAAPAPPSPPSPPPPPPPSTPTTPAGGTNTMAKQAGDAQTAVVGAAVAIAPAVIVRDASGLPVPGASVTFAVASGGGTVTGASQTTDANGIATVGKWTLGATAGANTLSATSGSLSVIFSATAVNPPPPALDHFLVEASGGGAIGTQTAGVPFSIRITAQDVNNNVVTSFTSTVSVTSSGTLTTGSGATAAFTAGVLANHSVTLTKAGSFTITAASGPLAGTSATFAVNAAPVNHFVVEAANGGPIGTQVAGAPFTIRVTAQDSFDNTATSFTGTVDITSTGTLVSGGGTTPAFVAGVLASRSVTIGNAGTFKISATRTSGSETGASNTFTVNAASVSRFDVEAVGGGPIGTQTAGAPFTIRITARDASGNVATDFNGVADITSNRAGSAGLTTTAAFTAGVLASHSVTLTQAGTGATLTATSGSQTGTSAAFTINAAGLQHLVVEAQGGGSIGSQTAGVPFGIRITAQDQFDNTASSFTGTVDVTSNRTGSAGLTTSAAFTAGVLAAHNVTLTQAGSGATITATRTGGTETGTSTTFTVNAAAVQHFVVEAAAGGPIGTQIAGTPFSIRITAQDQFNNTAAGFTGTVDVTSNRAGSAGLTTSAAFTAGVLASHSVTLTQSGTGATITATRSGGTETGTSVSFAVDPAGPARFDVEAAGGGPIGTQTAGAPFNVRITARDASGNVATSFTGTVNVTSNRAGSAGLTTSAAFSAGVLATHSVTLTQSGSSSTITATRTGGTETGTSNAFTVNAAALAKFAVEAQGGGAIATQTAGVAFNVRVTAQDQFNNTVTAFTGTVDVTSNRAGSGGLTTSAAFTAGVLAAHSITLTQAGTGSTITVTRTGGAETGTSAPFTVNAAALNKFLVESSAGGSIPTQTAAVPFSIRVTAQDQFANTVTTFTGTVDVTSNGTLGAGSGTSAAFVAGVLANHSVTITNTGTFHIVVTHTGGAETGQSNDFLVNPGPLHHFLIEAAGGGPVPTQTAGVSFNIRVTAQDAGNNTVTAFAGTVDVTSNRTGTQGLTTSAAFTAGVLATHAVTLTQAGSGAILTVTRTGGTETGSATFTVNPGPVHHFVVEAAGGGPIATQLVNNPFNIRITAQDQFNNTATQFTGAGNTVDITTTGGGTLSAGGGTTAAFTSGVLATHSVTFNNTGTFRLVATRTGGTETGMSNAFDVLPALALTATDPPDGAVDVPLNKVLTITFNRSVNATTSSFTIECPTGSGLRAFSLSASPSATYTLTPSAPLPAGEVCTVTVVAAQVTDLFGFHPGANIVFAFTTRFHANDDIYPQTVIGNVSINSANIPFSVVTNDTIGAAAAITFVGFGVTPGVSENGGVVAITASGAGRGQFTYNPPVGFTGTDHFTYTVTQGGLTSSATVTLSVSGLVWFINDNAGACTTSCDGRLSNPFVTLADFQAVNDGVGRHPRAGNSIFIYQSATDYIGPVTLLDNQKLIGQDATVSLATLFGTTPPSGSAPFPAMLSGDGTRTRIAGLTGGVTLASGANAFIHGLTIATTGGTALASAATFGTLTFANGTSETADVTIDATGGGAMSLTSGAVSGVMTSVSSTGGVNGLQLDALTGSLTINGGALSGSSGPAVTMTAGNASVTYTGTITQTTDAKAVSVSTRTGGTVDMAGNIICTAPCRGITVQDNTGGVTQFTGASKALSTADIDAVLATGNAGSSLRFTGGGLQITTVAGTAFTLGTGTIAVTGSNNTIVTSTGAGMILAGSTVDASGVTFQSVTSGGSGGASNNLRFSNVTGGSVSLAGGSLSGAAVNAILVSGGSSNITFAGTITSTVTGVNVSTYGGALTLSGTSKAITSGANKGVVLASNSGSVAFTNGGLVVASTSGNAFEATGGGTVSVSGTGNTLTSTTGIALDISGTTSGGLTFQSISAAGGANGIFYSGAGAGGLTVTGNGGRCDTGLTTCTGGIINATTGADNTTNGIGVYLNNASNVTLKKMRLAGTHQNFGVFGSSMSNVTLDTLLFNGTFGTTTAEATLAFDELSGSALVRGSTMAPASGSMGDNVRVRNTTAITLNRITFDADTVGFTGNNGSNALYVLARAGTLNATVQNSLLRGGKQKGAIFTDTLSATSDFIFTGNNVQQGTAGITYGNPVGSAFQITMSGATTTTYTISNNTWSNLVNAANAALAIFAGQTTLGLTGSATGTITSNAIGSAGTPNSGSRSISVDLETIGSGTHQVKYTGNSIVEYGDNAFMTTVGGDNPGLTAPRFDLTFAGNIIKQPRAAAGVVVGVSMLIGLRTADAPTMCMNFGAGNQNEINASSNVDVPFVLGSTTGSNGFLKLVNYPGGPDPGGATAESNVNTTMRAGILNSTLDGLVDLTGVSQVGNENAAIGRTCSLPSP